MRYLLTAACLLGVAHIDDAAAQTGKECAILKRALYGDKIVDANRILSGEPPADLQWPVPGGGRPNFTVGKGDYSFYFHFTDAAAHTKAKQMFEALDKQVSSCLPNTPRIANGLTNVYCPPGTAKIVNVGSAFQAKFGEASLNINPVTNRAQSCR